MRHWQQDFCNVFILVIGCIYVYDIAFIRTAGKFQENCNDDSGRNCDLVSQFSIDYERWKI